MEIIFIFIIAISLSMDAFSLSLAYGTINLSKKDINTVSIIVGIYHFFMPILGMIVGIHINNLINIGENIIIFIIFSVIGINMIIESIKEQEKVKRMKLIEMIFFGFAVSVDSFSIGIGINNISNNFLLCSIIFSITSFVFTYIGLVFGKKLNLLIGKIAPRIGGISLILLGLIYIIK